MLLLGKLHSVLSSGPVVFSCSLIQPSARIEEKKSSLSDAAFVIKPFPTNHSTFSLSLPCILHLALSRVTCPPPPPLLLCLISFLSRFLPPSALSCWDKLMHEFPTAPHHGRLPYQGQESALQHLQHFIGALSECRGRRESEAPQAGIHRRTLLSPLLFSMTGQEWV